MTTKGINRKYRRRAAYANLVFPVWLSVAGRNADEYERLYLTAWQGFYRQHPHYLYKDDRYCDEWGPNRTEDVSAISTERTAAAVKQARTETDQALAEQAERLLATARGHTFRAALADLLKKTAQRLAVHLPIFEDLNDIYFAPALPPAYSSIPERAVDEPERVGGALGLLVSFFALEKRFLKAESTTRPRLV